MAERASRLRESRRVSFDLRLGGRTSNQLLESDSRKSDHFEEEVAPQLGGFESADALGEEVSDASAHGRDSSRRDSTGRRRSVSVAEVAEDLSSKDELVGTVASIALSLVDVALHVAVAVHIQAGHGGGQAAPYWWFIALALAANLVAIVFYIYKNVGAASPAQNDSGGAVWAIARSDIELKLAERPEELVFVMVAGVVTPECLCFLSLEACQRLRFRRMATLTALFEGTPIFFCLLLFAHVHGWSPLLACSFASTVCGTRLEPARRHAATRPLVRLSGRPHVRPSYTLSPLRLSAPPLRALSYLHLLSWCVCRA